MRGKHFWPRGARKLALARAFGPPRFCVEGSSLWASRGVKPWQGRTLEGSGGSGALLDPRGSAWNFLLSRGAKPWQGLTPDQTTHTNQRTPSNAHQASPSNAHQRTRRPAYTNQLAPTSNAHQRIRTNQRAPQAMTPMHTNERTPSNAQPTHTNAHHATHPNQGTAGVRFWTPAVLRGRVVAFGPEGRETVAGACSIEVSGSGGARFWTPRGSAWKGRHFGSRGARNRGSGVLQRALAVGARAFGPPRWR